MHMMIDGGLQKFCVVASRLSYFLHVLHSSYSVRISYKGLNTRDIASRLSHALPGGAVTKPMNLRIILRYVVSYA